MFVKQPRASTDARVRSLLQKATRRGFAQVADLATRRLESTGDRAWLRSRAVVITFEECWPLAESLVLDRQPSSKRDAIANVAQTTKQKDAAGLGALAYAFSEGDNSMIDGVPDARVLRIAAEAVRRPAEFFDWSRAESKSEQSGRVVETARTYFAAATWAWDKACILAGALLATIGAIPKVERAATSVESFPFWVALDKHTPIGKTVLTEIAPLVRASYRQLIWSAFYNESAMVNVLLPSPWWEAEKTWRLRRTGLSAESAGSLWARARDLVRERLSDEARLLRELIDGGASSCASHQADLF